MNSCLLISGASRGIGKATAALFQHAGWRVVNISRHPCSLEKVANVELDLTKDLTAKKEVLLNAIGQPDRLCLVHNAAALFKDSVYDLPEGQLRHAMEVNLIAPMLLNTMVIPLMKPGSSIIYVGSTLSTLGIAGAASYIVTKHGLLGLMRATCQDLKERDITTTCICPGFTDTEMLHEHIGTDPQQTAAILGQTGARRLITPTEIAETIFFCATHPAVNGAVLHANIGQGS